MRKVLPLRVLALLINPPKEYQTLLGTLPEGEKLVAKINPPVEAAHVFADKSAALAATLSKL